VRIRATAILIALILMTGAAFASNELAGTYDLLLSDDPGWHGNLLTVTSSSDDVLKGTVSIDWGLGPQARAPQPDERVHVLPFTARRDKSGAYRFTVEVGKQAPTRYDFEIYVLRREATWLAGTVTLQRVVEKGDPQVAGPFRQGVLALLHQD